MALGKISMRTPTGKPIGREAPAPAPTADEIEQKEKEATEWRKRLVLSKPSVDPDLYMELVSKGRRFEDIASPDCDRSGRAPSRPMVARGARGEAMT